jgi:hypothetical protein
MMPTIEVSEEYKDDLVAFLIDAGWVIVNVRKICCCEIEYQGGL